MFRTPRAGLSRVPRYCQADLDLARAGNLTQALRQQRALNRAALLQQQLVRLSPLRLAIISL